MPLVTIGLYQIEDPDLLALVLEVTRLSGFGRGTMTVVRMQGVFTHFCPDAGMAHIMFMTVDPGQLIKILSPVRLDQIRVFQVGLIDSFKVGGITAIKQ